MVCGQTNNGQRKSDEVNSQFTAGTFRRERFRKLSGLDDGSQSNDCRSHELSHPLTSSADVSIDLSAMVPRLFGEASYYDDMREITATI